MIYFNYLLDKLSSWTASGVMHGSFNFHVFLVTQNFFSEPLLMDIRWNAFKFYKK